MCVFYFRSVVGRQTDFTFDQKSFDYIFHTINPDHVDDDDDDDAVDDVNTIFFPR